MESLESNHKKALIDDVIKHFGEDESNNYFSIGSNPKRKIKIRRVLETIKNRKHMIVIEQKKQETQKWEIVCADVTLISKNNKDVETLNKNDYKYIGFDIFCDLIEGVIIKSIFIQFSYHSLERMFERCDMKQLSSAEKIKQYFSSMIKPFLLRCLTMIDQKIKNLTSYMTKEESLSKIEDFIVIDGLFMPIVMEIGKNRFNKLAFSFTIKSIMPEEFNGAQRTINEKEQKQTKENVLDYYDNLKLLIVQKH